MSEGKFSIVYTTKGSPESTRGLPFDLIKKTILGKNYELSIVFCGPKRSRFLNKKFRGQDKPTDILSFPLSKGSGEIFIDISSAEKEARKFNRPLRNFLLFLFIHGAVHLKGFKHGSKMEQEEIIFRRKFKI
ncbi:MAG: rRNA maturation RNase YbeY [bacterium]|nr:rRNA maturation RNase YbeY [bacterium]